MKNNIIVANSKESIEELRINRFDLFNAFNTLSIVLGNKTYEIREGFTLTPFANAKLCNAHCRFCSEELIPNNKEYPSSKDLITNYQLYFKGFQKLLNDLSKIDLRLSLSGLEATNDYDWLKNLTTSLSSYNNITEKVLYTNGSGLLDNDTLELIFQNKFDKIELSRVHYNEIENQKIMLFNKNVAVKENIKFEKLVIKLLDFNILKISCILTKNTISTLSDVKLYLEWLIKMEVKEVVFRELSIINSGYKLNTTLNWIKENTIPIMNILNEILNDKEFEYSYSTSGYYYYNEIYTFKNKIKVIFETSSYDELKSKNEDTIIHKLIYHSNGNLTKSWDSETHILNNYNE